MKRQTIPAALRLFTASLAMVLAVVLALSSCEDVIDVNLNRTPPRLVVDAWLTDQPGEQTIKLRLTASYLDNNPAPRVSGATVTVQDNEGKLYEFTDPDNNGDYVWMPTENAVFGTIGNTYTLQVVYQGQTYQAVSRLNPTVAVETITYEKRAPQLNRQEGYWATLVARDRPETGNCYWIRTYKNGSYLNKPGEINLAYDAGFANTGLNNQAFIQPIAEQINPQAIDNEPPYQPGDQVRVEIWSISGSAYNFLSQAQSEMTNSGLFATVPSNTESNVRNISGESERVAQGFFCVSAVSSGEVKIQ
jgi:hypothetical protein